MESTWPKTTREASEHLGIPYDRFIRSAKRLHLQPSRKAGRTYLWSANHVKAVQKALEKAKP